MTRWTGLAPLDSSKADLHHTINFRALYGADLVTLRSIVRADETRILHRAGGQYRAKLRDWKAEIDRAARG